MSVLGFDIRDYTDPQRMLEESIRAPFGTVVSPQPPMSPPPQAPAQPPAPQQQPPAPQTAPVTIDQGTGSVVNAPAGINPAATVPSGVSASTPASIAQMEGVTNQDRLNAMAMVLGAVGQNNFSQVLGAAQAGLMEKEMKAKEYNAQLAQLTQPQIAVEDGKLNYTPPMWEVDSNGNYQARSADAIKKDLAEFYGSDVGKEKLTGEARGSHSRYVNELYEKRVAPLEDAIDKSDMALSYANYYYEDSTKAQRTQADRALIKAVEKLWDANSAVLQGEFEAAESAQDVITQLQRASDPTTGETLGQESRAAMLDLIYRATDEMAGKYNRGAQEVHEAADAAFSPYQMYDENYRMAVPQAARWRDENGQFVGRPMSAGWEELRNTGWYKDNVGAKIPPKEVDIESTPELEAMAEEIERKRNETVNLVGTIE